MPGIHYLCIPLLLHGVVSSKVPDFVHDHGDYEVCEGDACTYKYIYLWLEKTVQVPNRSVTYSESDYFDVNIVGLLADCAPSLSVGDIATRTKTCEDVEWKYRRACNYRKKGWLAEDGVTVKDTLDKDFDEITGVSKNILSCLGWDGVDDYFDYYYYGYYDYYGDYDYDYLEESGEEVVRRKREVQSSIPEFLIQDNHNRKKRNAKNNPKRKQKNKLKGSKRRKGSNGKAGRKGKRNSKKQMNHKNKHGKGRSGKKNGTSRKNKNRRRKIERNISNIKKKNEKKRKGKANNGRKQSKKEKKKERKILKKIGYKTMPSKEILNKLSCVERAIEYGLEKCGEEIFQEI